MACLKRRVSAKRSNIEAGESKGIGLCSTGHAMRVVERVAFLLGSLI